MWQREEIIVTTYAARFWALRLDWAGVNSSSSEFEPCLWFRSSESALGSEGRPPLRRAGGTTAPFTGWDSCWSGGVGGPVKTGWPLNGT